MKAKWIHDCNACKYLGSSIGDRRIFDWYECNDTTVARFGDYGPDYWSMPTTMIQNDDYLVVAMMSEDFKGYNDTVLLARFMLAQRQ